MDAYNAWAEKYDPDMEVLNYSTPMQIVQIALKYLGCDESIKLLDVACGTGLVGSLLRNNAFKGLLHGIDGSQEMLKIARKKEIYDELFTQFLLPGKPIMASRGLKYDAILCAGEITKNHLDPELLINFLDVLTTGGIIVFAFTKGTYNVEVEKAVDKVLKSLIISGKIEELELFVNGNTFEVGEDAVPENFRKEDSSSNFSSCIYCYQKK
uniref:methyltransferase-like protein 27 n=1 Tax=Styela clava TaxID=7725 RepID=UPI001939619B|nr:methyltransferase-like protein 27 [Styela clava]